MRFLGIDFGWQSQPSGLAAFALHGKSLRLIDLTRLEAPAEIVSWVDRFAGPNAIIAVDAPTLIGNATGMRLADKQTHSLFGRYHAGCYPASLARSYAARTVRLGLALHEMGFRHAFSIAARVPGRYQIEVSPHIAAVQLFGLDRIVKYKKGKIAERTQELARFRRLLDRLSAIEPCVLPMSLPEIPAGGAKLKEVEDQLDAVLAAYTGAFWWYWGAEKNQVLGDPIEGYLVAPMRL